jgi:hypothetical protein
MQETILVVDDSTDQCLSLVSLWRPLRRHIVCVVGCRSLPHVNDEYLAGFDLQGEPIEVHLAEIAGVILDGNLPACFGAKPCHGSQLVPTFLHHKSLVVGASGKDRENEAIIEAGAPMALIKPDVGMALLGELAPTEWYPWRQRFDETKHRPFLQQFDVIFRRANGSPPAAC